MKIAWISNINWDMPHKTSRLKMSEALNRRGNTVTLYMAKKFGQKVHNYKNVNIIFSPTINLPYLSGIFYGFIIFFYFPILLNKKNIDIIIIDGTKVWLPLVIPLKILNKPIILDIRTLPIDNKNLFDFKVVMYLSKFLVNGITTITQELKDTLIDVYNLKGMKIGVWSSGVSVEDFNFNNIEEIKFNKKESDKQDYTLIYHGDYSRTRGIENLIKAINKLDFHLKNKLKLIIIGIPKNKIKDLLKLSEDEGVKDQITILPKVDYSKLNHYLKIADVGVIPLPPENKWWNVSAPLKTLECLAAGKPVIATNIPFHYKIFEKGNCGILIESGSPEAIAEGITNMYKNKNNFREMGKEGRKIVDKFYTWDVMAEKFEKFLKTL